jgi:hypothetical protein
MNTVDGKNNSKERKHYHIAIVSVRELQHPVPSINQIIPQLLYCNQAMLKPERMTMPEQVVLIRVDCSEQTRRSSWRCFLMNSPRRDPAEKPEWIVAQR